MLARIAALLSLTCGYLAAHDGHGDRTYEIRASREPDAGDPVIELEIRDRQTGARLPARFSIEIDGKPWVPEALNEHGVRFTSIHNSKKQRETILFSRGTGPVRFAVPDTATKLTVHAVRGLQFRPVTIDLESSGGVTAATVHLERFADLEAEGWSVSDAHLHYERRNPDHDADWLTMLDADGLNQGFFMVLIGGNFRDRWAQQHGYGPDGEAKNMRQLLVSGEEFRGPMQGHNNLLGLSEVIEPISIGGMGTPPHPFNHPSTHDVLVRARELGGIGGPAHGGTFGKASTAVLDALLGASEFFELANTHLFETGPWYRVMNCGIHLPPLAGTDLPNYPFRDAWQPFFGEVRTFVKTGKSNDFDAWKDGVRAGRVFVSSGPILTGFRVGGKGLGESLDLPAGGGPVEIEAEVISSRPLSQLDLIWNGQPIAVLAKSEDRDGVHRATVRETIIVRASCWFAVRAFGPRKIRLFAEGKQVRKTMMHSAAIPVRLGGRPIRVEEDVAAAVGELREFRSHYDGEGKFPSEAARTETRRRFDEAIAKLTEE